MPDRHMPTSHRSALVLAALALVSGRGRAQGVIEPRHEIHGIDVTPWPCISYFANDEGRPIDVVGDVNGDGFDDLVFGCRTSGAGNCGYYDGFVSVVSGLDGHWLWKVAGQDFSGESLGYSVSGAGDWNADGTPDVVAGAPWADGGEGRVRLYSGVDGALLYSLSNPYPESSNNCGYSVSGIEDLNADGHDEVIVSFRGAGGGSSGRVIVLSGASGAIRFNLAAPNPAGLGSYNFGYVVRDGGDVTGDGVHDILVGHPGARNSADEQRGAVYVFSGATGALMHEVFGSVVGSGFGQQVDGVGDQNADGRDDFIATGDQQGWGARVISGMDASTLWSGGVLTTASGAGDVNGDGIEDFLVGYPNYTTGGYSGFARVIAGGTFATLYTFGYPNAQGRTGSALSRAGDINSDGFADFVVAAGGLGGRAHVYLGRPAPRELRRIEGSAAGDRVGFAVSGAGDVDADGYDDVIVGAPNDDTAVVVDLGSARVLSGFDGRTLVTCQGVAAGDLLGFAVSAAGDVNKDGFDDVIVGAPLNDLNGANAGEARVYSGRNGSELRRLPGPAAEAYFGRAVSDAGDVNGDGHADVIVGAPNEDVGTLVDAGSATVYSGADWSELHRWTGAAASDYFGYSVSGAGDVDGDGREDLVVGAYGADVNGLANSGSVTVYSGFDGMPFFTHHGSAAGDFLGFSVSGAGDVNKDGFADVIVGAKQIPISAGGSGYARVLSGPTGTLLYQFDPDGGSNAAMGDGHQLLGYSVSGAGDVNGDGYADVIIGAPHFNISGVGSPGCARVHSGFDGGILLYQLQGDANNNIEFGNAVSGAGDVNGDGRDDVIVGAYLRDSGGLNDSGAAYVYSLGYPGETPKRRKGQAPPGPTITFP